MFPDALGVDSEQSRGKRKPWGRALPHFFCRYALRRGFGELAPNRQAGSARLSLARRRQPQRTGRRTETDAPCLQARSIVAIRRTGAHLGTTAGRGGPKSETRNPKPETNSNAQWSKAQDRQQGSGFGHSLLGAWGLFRASSFGYRVSALRMAVVPSCARCTISAGL